MTTQSIDNLRGRSAVIPDATVSMLGEDAYDGVRAFEVNGESVDVRWRTAKNGIASYVSDEHEYRIESPESAQRFSLLQGASSPGNGDLGHLPEVTALGRLDSGEVVYRTPIYDDLSPQYPKAWNGFCHLLYAWHKAKNDLIGTSAELGDSSLMEVGTAITTRALSDETVPKSLKDAYGVILAQLPWGREEDTGYCMRLNAHDFRVDADGELTIYEGFFDAKQAGFDLPLRATPLAPILAEMTNPSIRGIKGMQAPSEDQLGFAFSTKRTPPISVSRFQPKLKTEFQAPRMAVPSL